MERLCELWKAFSESLDDDGEREDLLIKGVEELKKNSRSQIFSVKIPALLRLFDLLEHLAARRNPLAAVLYKKLVFLLIENHASE